MSTKNSVTFIDWSMLKKKMFQQQKNTDQIHPPTPNSKKIC